MVILNLFLTPTMSVDFGHVISSLENFIDLFGVPKRIIADRSSAFTSETFDECCKTYGIVKHITARAKISSNNFGFVMHNVEGRR